MKQAKIYKYAKLIMRENNLYLFDSSSMKREMEKIKDDKKILHFFNDDYNFMLIS